MTPRLPFLLAIFGAVLATEAVTGLEKLAGPAGVWLGLAVIVGTGLVVAFLVGGLEVQVEDGDGQP